MADFYNLDSEMYKSDLSKECIEFIKKLCRKGFKYTQIYEECLKQNFTPKPTYCKVRYHARKVYTSEQKKIIQLDFIESTTSLCKEMTTWIQQMRNEYNELQTEKLVKKIMKLYHQKILTSKRQKEDLKIELETKMKILMIQNGEKRNLRYSLNKGFENFVELLKTPAIQTTQVNILQQQLEQSLKGVIDERAVEPIKIAD